MRKKLFLLLLSALLFTCSMITVFATDSTFKSQGTIVFTNDTDDTSDDVIFDASDFTTLGNKCK